MIYSSVLLNASSSSLVVAYTFIPQCTLHAQFIRRSQQAGNTHTHGHTNFQLNEWHKPPVRQTWVVMCSRVAAHRSQWLLFMLAWSGFDDGVFFRSDDEDAFPGRLFLSNARHSPTTMLSSNTIQSFNVRAATPLWPLY